MATSSSRFLQFSVREVLFAMVAIAAILALIVSHSPYSPTRFMATLDLEAELKKVCSDLNILLDTSGHFGGGGGSSDEFVREYHFSIVSPDLDEFHSKIMPALHDHFEKQLLDEGASIYGREHSGNIPGGSLMSFGFSYHRSGSRGRIRIYCFGQGERVELLMLAEER